MFTMFDYLEDMIVECAEDLKNSCSYYLGHDQLFKVAKDSSRLPLENTDIFNSYVARLLFASKRARPNIQVCVTSLCTRVKSPTEQDYTKIVTVISK